MTDIRQPVPHMGQAVAHVCNTQSELHPLEEGKHAAQSGMDLKAYAEASGKGYQGLYYKQRGYAVYHVVNEDHKDAQDNWRNLAEIHAAPNWLWKALVAEMLEQSWYLDTDTAWPEPSKS